MNIFYTPADGACGDFIPYYNKTNKCFDIFYLHDYRNIELYNEGTPWRRISTTDFLRFSDAEEVIARGGSEEQDLFIYTGCVLEADNKYHIYYTGHNYHYPEKGLRKESVMHAISDDGKTYTKIKEDTFYAPELPEIEKDDWRDPFVFWNEEKGEYWMLLCTRLKKGPSRRRGATGLLTSSDLKKWEYQGSLWEPSLCWCPECPDLFQWGDYWYLIYSTFCDADGFKTYYRIATSPNGPFLNPGNNSIDSRAFYAGKTAFDGENRYIFGWNPSKLGDTDNGTWQWGGSLIVHKLIQNADGSLDVTMPEIYEEMMETPHSMTFTESIGDAKLIGDIIKFTCPDSFCAIQTKDVSKQCMISFDIKMDKNTDGAGIMIGASDDLNDGYYLRIEPRRGKFVFDLANRRCDHPEIERYTTIDINETHNIKLIIDGSIILAYLDNKVALSARMYQPYGNNTAFFAFDGGAEFTQVTMSEYKERN